MAGLVWVMTDFRIAPSDWLAYVTWVVAVFIGVTMVSNIALLELTRK